MTILGPFSQIWGKKKFFSEKSVTQRKKIKKPTPSFVNAGTPDRVSVLSTKYGGCHPKGLIVACSYKIKQIIIILKLLCAKADSPFC